MDNIKILFTEYKYDLDELIKFINVLITDAKNKDIFLTHDDMIQNLELLQTSLVKLTDKATILHNAFKNAE